MAKEVAEKIVRGITDKIECNTVDIDDWAEFWGFTREEYEDFLDMAIKALEQEPCPNAISRSDMLDAVGHGMTYTSEDLQKIIKGLPPVNPQPKIGKWIEERTYIECPFCHDIWHYEKNQVERFKCCPTCGERIKQ